MFLRFPWFYPFTVIMKTPKLIHAYIIKTGCKGPSRTNSIDENKTRREQNQVKINNGTLCLSSYGSLPII